MWKKVTQLAGRRYLLTFFHKLIYDIITAQYEYMNKTSLAITLLAIVAATAIGLVTTQSAAAQFDTTNSATQSSTQDGTATGGAGGAGGFSVLGSANGGPGGSASVSQFSSQQAAQSGAFGTSSNTFTPP
jgi:hypothetical protein